jgi:hypothetical protein
MPVVCDARPHLGVTRPLRTHPGRAGFPRAVTGRGTCRATLSSAPTGTQGAGTGVSDGRTQ